MLFKSQFWHAKRRQKLYEENKPAYVLPLTWRPDFLYQDRIKGGKSASPTMEVAWTVWIEGNENSVYYPLLKPLNNISELIEDKLFSENLDF